MNYFLGERSMLAGWGLVLSAFFYLCVLFAVAYWGDNSFQKLENKRIRSFIYALALAVYCTSWTFFGSVGLATRSGLDFLTIYIGPIIVVSFGYTFVTRVVKIAKAQNSTSIADFIAARYGKSERVAAIVTLIAVVGCVPYIALQLKAVSVSLKTFMMAADGSYAAASTPFGDIALFVACVLAAFAVAFGTRNADATEHHDGLVMAISLESLVKLISFIAVGLYVVIWMRGGLINAVVPTELSQLITTLMGRTSSPTNLATLIVLAGCAALMLPRQFHMTVVENKSLDDVRSAAWQFPLYLLLINIFVLPIALAGIAFLPQGVDRDMTVLLLPLQEQAGWIALIAFIGGFSAATAMVIVELVALAIMISNHWVMPLVLRQRGFNTPEYRPIRYADLSGLVLMVRRVAIAVVVAFAYLYSQASGNAALASMGLLAFAAIAQIAPSMIGAMFWKQGTALGACLALVAGFAVWVYTLLLPSVAGASNKIVSDGPFGIAWLKPTALFGSDMSTLTHGVFWSLVINFGIYVVFSLLRQPSALEKIQADAFVGTDEGMMPSSFRLWRTPVTVEEVQSTVARYLGEDRTLRAFQGYAEEHSTALNGKVEADAGVLRFAEHLLASAIGAASSRLALSLLLTRRNVSTKAALQLLDDASAAIQYNRDLLQHALDHARQGITVLDRDLKILCWNHAFIDLYDLPSTMMKHGVGLDDVVRFNAQRGLYGPGAIDELVTARLYSLSHRTEPVRLKLYPSQRWIEIRSNHLPDGGLVTTYTDVSDAVVSEEARQRANEFLEKRVEERTEELTALNDALAKAKADAEEANASKTRFLAAASHDILQPLNAARLYAASLVERDKNAGDSNLADNVDASLDAVEEILNALLEISRLDTNSLKPDWTVIRLDDIFKQLQRDFGPVAEKKGLKLIFVPTSLAVRSDKRMLKRMVQNLVSNAIKYTLTGRILVGVRRRKGRVKLEVWDTGQGVPASQHKLIFQEFQRLDQGAKIAPGLGLGLSIVERIGRVLGHPLHLESKVGKGSLFSIEISGAPSIPEVKKVEEALPQIYQPLSGMRIMVVDNEPSILDGMRTLLSGWGCDVLTALDPKDALSQAKAKELIPDAIIADYHLDDGNGLDGIAMIRWQIRHDLPAVLLTADRSDGIREETLRRNVRLLNKPVKPAALRSLLGQWRSGIITSAQDALAK
jgi:Na+/proline symporter/signal transduction histidine kinase